MKKIKKYRKKFNPKKRNKHSKAPAKVTLMKSYSQFGEDKIISSFFPKNYKGIFIEVGSLDGITDSNTYYFELLGWKGVTIEANPNAFNSLVKNREFPINAAVGNSDNKMVDFYVVTLENGNQGAVSSLKIDQQLLDDHKSYNPTVNKVSVMQRTLDSIIREYSWINKIDFISIDTEGTELDVLKNFDILRWKPKLFVIENNDSTDNTIEQYMKKMGYKKVLRNIVNDFYTPVHT